LKSSLNVRSGSPIRKLPFAKGRQLLLRIVAKSRQRRGGLKNGRFSIAAKPHGHAVLRDRPGVSVSGPAWDQSIEGMHPPPSKLQACRARNYSGVNVDQ
jgi:hypothetical protein